MTTITFDTLRFVQRLEEAGISREQAEVVVRVIADAQESLVTNHSLDSRLTEMELRLESKIDKATSDLKVDLIKWMAGSLIAQAAVIATLVKLL